MKRIIRIMIGILAVLVGMGLVLPALAQWRHEGTMNGSSVGLCLLGAVLTLAGCGTAIRSVPKQNA